jgi:hypothetical protein
MYWRSPSGSVSWRRAEPGDLGVPRAGRRQHDAHAVWNALHNVALVTCTFVAMGLCTSPRGIRVEIGVKKYATYPLPRHCIKAECETTAFLQVAASVLLNPVDWTPSSRSAAEVGRLLDGGFDAWSQSRNPPSRDAERITSATYASRRARWVICDHPQ